MMGIPIHQAPCITLSRRRSLFLVIFLELCCDPIGSAHAIASLSLHTNPIYTRSHWHGKGSATRFRGRPDHT